MPLTPSANSAGETVPRTSLSGNTWESRPQCRAGLVTLCWVPAQPSSKPPTISVGGLGATAGIARCRPITVGYEACHAASGLPAPHFRLHATTRPDHSQPHCQTTSRSRVVEPGTCPDEDSKAADCTTCSYCRSLLFSALKVLPQQLADLSALSPLCSLPAEDFGCYWICGGRQQDAQGFEHRGCHRHHRVS